MTADSGREGVTATGPSGVSDTALGDSTAGGALLSVSTLADDDRISGAVGAELPTSWTDFPSTLRVYKKIR